MTFLPGDTFNYTMVVDTFLVVAHIQVPYTYLCFAELEVMLDFSSRLCSLAPLWSRLIISYVFATVGIRTRTLLTHMSLTYWATILIFSMF